MTPIKVQLTFIRSSKNYHVYQAEPGAPVIPDKIYVRQDALGPDAPVTLVLTLSSDADRTLPVVPAGWGSVDG